MIENIINYENFLNTLVPTILSWEHVGLSNIDCEVHSDTLSSLDLLNQLLKENEDDLENKLVSIIMNNKITLESVLGLVAINVYSGQYIKGKNSFLDISKKGLADVKNIWDVNEIIYFFNTSGIKKVLQNKSIYDLKSYYMGINFGATGTNKRKNSSGAAMELLSESIIDNFCSKKGYKYLTQASIKDIKECFNIEVSLLDMRRYDFVICTENKKLYFIEVNYYSASGSKLKATCGEYITYNQKITESGHSFIWITDGLGWKGAKKPMKEAYDKISYIINLDMINSGILDKIVS